MTTGTLLLMWIGEQITEKGIGNGMSLIITIGILSSLPTALGMIFQQLNLDSQEPGQMNFSTIAVLAAVFIFVTIATIIDYSRASPHSFQYARRVVGRKEVQGGSSYIPLKVNYAGVIPVIFASSLLMFPATLGHFIGVGNWLGEVVNLLSPGTPLYLTFYVVLIIFFTYFWTATQFRPDQIASDMKKNGAFIPGLDKVSRLKIIWSRTMNRITLIGAVFLALIAILPQWLGSF